MGMLTLGIDIGSTASKCVILEDGKNIIATSLVSSGTGTTGPDRAIAQVYESAGRKAEDMAYILATGYGRNTIASANEQMSELSCHAKGAGVLFPGVRTVIDIGGQDAKVLSIDENGLLMNFVMNDKCAAGTGRFLDVMARILETDVESLAELGAKSTNRVDISSTCTVFAESEVISQLAKGRDICDIVDGVHRSVASRVGNLAKRIPIEPIVVMTGGVARNSGVLKALENELGVPVMTSEMAQYNGALGAAAIAYDKATR